jgi:CubicO group peptidase (beta-lactamase class C family)
MQRGMWVGLVGWACLVISVQAAAATVAVFPDELWRVAMPASQGVDAAGLQGALDYLQTHAGGAGVDEMVVVRNGTLVWQGPDADRVHEIYSCTKTFTSTVLGLLAADGAVGVDDYAVRYWAALDDQYPEYGQIRLSDFASMTSGYDGAMGGGWQFYRTDRARHLEHVLSYTTPGPPLFLAGTSFKYHDAAVHMLGYILTKVAGRSLQEVFKQRVADPIGMKHFRWSDYGQRGVYSSALDLARYGLLYLNQGSWKGRQIFDPTFVARATSTQVAATVPTKYSDLTGRYGFFWWTNGVRADGTRPWPSAPPRTFTAHGAGRNFIFVVPEWNLVLVRLSPAPDGEIHLGTVKKGVWAEFFGRLKASIAEGLSGDGPAVQ